MYEVELKMRLGDSQLSQLMKMVMSLHFWGTCLPVALHSNMALSCHQNCTSVHGGKAFEEPEAPDKASRTCSGEVMGHDMSMHVVSQSCLPAKHVSS